LLTRLVETGGRRETSATPSEAFGLVAETRGTSETRKTRVIVLINPATTGRSMTAEVTATTPHNDSPELTSSVIHSKVLASHQSAALNWHGRGHWFKSSTAQLDQEIAQVRSGKESVIDVRDFEHAAVLRDREQQLLGDKAARQQEWAALPSLSDEVERLRDLLRRYGIDPQDGVA
jgi:hypothetical protein